MIPKVIHYCWFGGNPLPKNAIDCINSWKKHHPDYEIKEWNESNFDVNSIPYTKDAYEAKNYAFVSDYARFKILYEHGGLYFDTDVEIISPLTKIVEDGSFMAWEAPDGNGNHTINPGLGLGSMKNNPFYKEVLSGFERLNYYQEDGIRNPYSMIPMVTNLLYNYGLKLDGSLQEVNHIKLYPAEYFCPMNALTGIITTTNNTLTIHHYSMSWMSKKKQRRLRMTRFLRRLIGDNNFSKIKKLFN